ncbi:hypothetical protein [Mobiluncus curtisii]|uniref:Uncharacterized protein n=1 Tax=Mobiluncus curtisii ATCC 51333 TaxID=887326 RepID=E6LXA1_9ACTO|nr:hypothetical protein [Mobiluncus curtisii]EFU80655.1 hypothetical protein HMPREF0388_0374 [Mobiluncus curtisii ATCC 51333]
MSANRVNSPGWEGELDRLEAQIVEDRKLLKSGQIPPEDSGWQPPQLGPLPPDLAPRARRVQKDLSDLGKKVRFAMKKNQEELRRAGEERDKLRKIPPENKSAPTPRYVDFEG